MWASPDVAQSVDVLFVDEAAQMSLANVLALPSGAATQHPVGSSSAFEVSCRTPRQMQLANAFCRYLELAMPCQSTKFPEAAASYASEAIPRSNARTQSVACLAVALHRASSSL